MYEENSCSEGSCSLKSGSESLIGYTVYDVEDRRIGAVESVWEDDSGQPGLLGVRTGWLGMGRLCAVPARSVSYSGRLNAIRVPYSKDFITDAPAVTDSDEFLEADQQRVYEYYSAFDTSREAPSATKGPMRESDAAQEKERTLQLEQEELKVGKRRVEAGGVRLRKVVRTETVQQPVTLQREEVEVERVPASEAQARGSFSEEEIFIPLYREEPVVEKTARVSEQVRARKTEQVEQENVSGEVRKEDVQVEREEPTAPRR